MWTFGKELSLLLRFLSVGIVATLVHVSVGLVVVTSFDVALQVANLIAFSSAFLVSFYGHHRVTFASNRPYRAALPRFVVTALIGLAASSLVIWGLKSSVMLVPQFKFLIGASVVPAITYVLGRFWVY